MRIGVVDLDTSHPGSWIPIIRDLGHEVAAVWDGGTIWDEDYVTKFTGDHSIERVATSLEEMVDLVDCAIIHSCNWDLHASRAKVFVDRGIPVLIDKPMVGNLRDIRQLAAWSEAGHRVCGGSSLRFNYEAKEFLAIPEEERGVPFMAVAGCGVDDFNYGIHAYSLLWSIFGPGAESVRYLGEHVQKQIEITWSDGRRGILSIGNSGNWLPFYATIVTSKGVHHLTVDASRIYRALLEASLPYLSGKVSEPPIPMEQLIEPELAAIAAMESKQQGGTAVNLSALTEDGLGYDGTAFGIEYKKIRTGKA